MDRVEKIQLKFTHAQKRLFERFDINIDKDGYFELCKLSNEDGLYYKCFEPSNHVDLRLVRFKGRLMTVVYDHELKMVNTVLFPRPRDKGNYRKMVKIIKRNKL